MNEPGAPMSGATKSEGNDLQWFTVPNPPGWTRPKWARSAAVDENGTIFAPAAMTGNEEKASWCAGWDGNVKVVLDSGHVYLPTTWPAENYPDVADICEKIEQKLGPYR